MEDQVDSLVLENSEEARCVIIAARYELIVDAAFLRSTGLTAP